MNPSIVSRETLPQLYVVEGKHDAERLSSFFFGPILTTNGTAVSTDLIKQLLTLETNYEIVLLLDPDGPGEKIRRVLANALNQPTHAYIPAEVARSKDGTKIGIEHVSRETFQECLQQHPIQPAPPISTVQLVNLGLMGVEGSARRRWMLCRHFNIGQANAKTLRHKLQMFGLRLCDVETALKELYE